MIYLKYVDFIQISAWFTDYQKKSKNFEIPPEGSQYIGVFKGEELIGYFITLSHASGLVEINQGYLKPTARHKSYSKIAMKLLEDAVKVGGFKEISLATNRAVGSYQKFMKQCGFELTKAIFSKKVN